MSLYPVMRFLEYSLINTRMKYIKDTFGKAKFSLQEKWLEMSGMIQKKTTANFENSRRKLMKKAGITARQQTHTNHRLPCSPRSLQTLRNLS